MVRVLSILWRKSFFYVVILGCVIESGKVFLDGGIIGCLMLYFIGGGVMI